MAKKDVKVEEHVSLEGYVPNLQKKYKEEIIAKLQKEFGFKSIMQVPKLVKITINQGIGDATGDKKLVEVAQQDFYRWSEGGYNSLQERYFQLQAPQGNSHRC